jgi:selenocysteine lyase/cysteine desulfurase
VLRVSPHVDTTAEELETFGQALEQATDLLS